MTVPRAEILIVDDLPANLHILSVALEEAGHSVLVATSGASALRSARENRPSLILLDVVMPGMDGYEVCRALKADETTREIPVIFLSAQDEKGSLLAGFEAGGVDYITKPFESEEVLVRVRTHLQIHHLTQALQCKNEELEESNARLREETAARKRADARLDAITQQEAARIEGFVGASPAIETLMQEVAQLQASAGTSVLVQGESGTGKELIARALHFGSPRARGPFVAVNAAAIAADLAESQLFGHVRGAFTGAQSDHRGYFEQADGGTLFLDEIGDMSADLQSKLLRVLEEGTVRPVGAVEERSVDVRVVAATHMDLAQQLNDGGFRRDLYFRLAHFRLEVPPLRARLEDIALLSESFIDTLATEIGRPPPTLSARALAQLQAYGFPGNVRELRNMIEYALLKCDDSIQPEHLHFLEVPAAAAAPAAPVSAAAQPAPKDEDLLLAYVRQQGTVNNPQIRDLLQVDQRRASYLLDKLCTAGLLVREGAKRHARYTLPA